MKDARKEALQGDVAGGDEPPAAGVRAPEPRRRNPKETLERIILAAEEEFRENGFEGATIPGIARRGRLSKQIIFYYYSGKADIYKDVMRRLSIAVIRALMVPDYERLEPEEALRIYVATLFEQFVNRPALAAATLDQGLHDGVHVNMDRDALQMRRAVLARLSQILARGVEAGTMVDGVDADHLQFVMVNLISGYVLSRPMYIRMLREKKFEDEDGALKEFCSQFILRALRK